MQAKRILVGLVVAAILVVGASYLGAQPTEPYAIGTMTMTGKQAAAGVGYTWGVGTLRFKDKEYKFKVRGLQVGAVGGSTIDAVGDVYNLKEASDFAGNYVAGGGGASLVKGETGLLMRNTKGVVINLRAKQPGVQLNLGVQGFSVIMLK